MRHRAKHRPCVRPLWTVFLLRVDADTQEERLLAHDRSDHSGRSEAGREQIREDPRLRGADAQTWCDCAGRDGANQCCGRSAPRCWFSGTHTPAPTKVQTSCRQPTPMVDHVWQFTHRANRPKCMHYMSHVRMQLLMGLRRQKLEHGVVQRWRRHAIGPSAQRT
jgi:hypothetical protein